VPANDDVSAEHRLLGEALNAPGFFAPPIEAAATADTMTGFDPLTAPLTAAFPDAPQDAKACGALASISLASCWRRPLA
jgi:hypothetical protein